MSSVYFLLRQTYRLAHARSYLPNVPNAMSLIKIFSKKYSIVCVFFIVIFIVTFLMVLMVVQLSR